ncbi:hypothetical protein C8A00DRAFT_45200 [Chaetomidium leptoderma]|uniref:Uncharacterized protein n=1 Tax=Chaetomidium leptoderma TaxID=669021 RepID=A0AAN6ZTS8_9PEZI|nr:hypothetical protein C8A00DRAFT_45200 [Chaetomidium leptoderma]
MDIIIVNVQVDVLPLVNPAALATDPLGARGQTVIAAVREPGHSTSRALADLTQGPGSTLITHGIDPLDLVVANAGISKQWPSVREVKRADIQEHVDVNVLGVVSLAKPIFASVGSSAGSLGRVLQQPPVPNASYGASKSMLNWYGVRINAEDEWLTAFILDPGWVQTDMGNRGARAWGMVEAPVQLDGSTDGMFKVLTTATKEAFGGRLVLYTGEIREW